MKAQRSQKLQQDKTSTNAHFTVGDRVFVFMPASTTGQMRKLACPFKGPYRVVATHPNGVEVLPVDKPRASVLRVALNRIRRCPKEIVALELEGNTRPENKAET